MGIPGGGKMAFPGLCEQGKWEAGISGHPTEVLLVPALLCEATWTGGCRTSRICCDLLTDLWRLVAFGSCEVFQKIGSSRRVCRGLQDKQPLLRPSLPSPALDRELFGFKRILQPELKTHCQRVSSVECDLKEAV